MSLIMENSDAYAVTVDEVKESELPVDNEPLETTEETIAVIQEQNEETAEEVSNTTIASEPTTK